MENYDKIYEKAMLYLNLIYHYVNLYNKFHEHVAAVNFRSNLRLLSQRGWLCKELGLRRDWFHLLVSSESFVSLHLIKSIEIITKTIYGFVCFNGFRKFSISGWRNKADWNCLRISSWESSFSRSKYRRWETLDATNLEIGNIFVCDGWKSRVCIWHGAMWDVC